MKKTQILITGILALSLTQAIAQLCNNPEFAQTVDQYIDYTIPTISTQELYQNWDNYIILDAREPDEYAVSHIPGAIWIGYDDPDYTVLDNIGKHKEIVIYCSIGYRSEQIGKQIDKQGYNNIHNLYGSIFEWANDNYPLENPDQEVTNKVHGYNKSWSKWIENDSIIKVYE